ncbi:aldo/keto reductase [filamentous cyanobacterium LEGE 11480]|uniref:Aldo/keto reductase n=1 Tax=Romeriopsis navalis LEGE 11480 TaxID=2777977 RepID=A0A928VTR6_9CYAN|nr:aldo/keto reductase [Romeriopsis navalis]MBE9032084.1 aldo/keto reductase [Romeriopsis navalis LEGE 11480]
MPQQSPKPQPRKPQPKPNRQKPTSSKPQPAPTSPIKLQPQQSLKASAYTELTADLQICRLINGMWQVSGSHGTIMPQRAIAAMYKYHQAGFNCWDLADHYGPAEDFIGAFRRKLKADRLDDGPHASKAFTKWVPKPGGGNISSITVTEKIQLALRRMGQAQLDLLHFHWWDYEDKRYLDALKHLTDLQAAGKIRHLGLTNFDTEHLQIVLDAGIPIVTNQIQFSLLDQRPLVSMSELCQQHDIKLLAYGTICGSFISSDFLGKPDLSRFQLNTASLRKYKNIIEAWGGWALFQELLSTLKTIADKHSVSISNVASRYVLEQPAVAGVIIGARLGVSEHIRDNARIFDFELDAVDREMIYAICDRSNDLFKYLGDCGSEYRG